MTNLLSMERLELLDLPLDIIHLIMIDADWAVTQLMFIMTCRKFWHNRVRIGYIITEWKYICCIIAFLSCYDNYINIFKYCYLNGARLSPNTIFELVRSDQVELLEFLFNRKVFNMAPWIYNDALKFNADRVAKWCTTKQMVLKIDYFN